MAVAKRQTNRLLKALEKHHQGLVGRHRSGHVVDALGIAKQMIHLPHGPLGARLGVVAPLVVNHDDIGALVPKISQTVLPLHEGHERFHILRALIAQIVDLHVNGVPFAVDDIVEAVKELRGHLAHLAETLLVEHAIVVATVHIQEQQGARDDDGEKHHEHRLGLLCGEVRIRALEHERTQTSLFIVMIRH